LLAHNDDGDTAMGGTAEGAPKTRLICVPKFSETGEAVLVNLKTLAVEILRFTANGDKKSD
jgi:DNA polymerase II small subunit/DNA polymerase delta subunit B